jgi:hypothetical protein
MNISNQLFYKDIAVKNQVLKSPVKRGVRFSNCRYFGDDFSRKEEKLATTTMW